jgi:DNA-binding MurR/RpiR family transcriptional regulator
MRPFYAGQELGGKILSYNINMSDENTVWENIRNNYESLYAAEAKVADFILNNPGQALEANVSETAELSGVSDATVVRFCKRIGYGGFYQMKLQLSHDMGKNWQINNQEKEGQNPDSVQERLLSITNIIMTISRHIDTEVMKTCAEAINYASTVFVIGNGYNKIMACDMIYRLTRKGVRCSGGGYSETDYENLYLGQEKDVAIFISRSGEDKKTYNEMLLAKKKKMVVISLTDAVKCPMSQLADYSLTTGIENRARVFIHENSSSLNMMVLSEILLEYVKQRHENKSYLDDVISEERM